MKKALILILFTVLLVSPGWAYDLNDIQSIEINAWPGGRGELKQGEISKLIIQRIDRNFVMENTENTVNNNLINNLLQVLNASMMDNVDLNNLGITNGWLIRNSMAMVNKYHRWDENQSDLIMKNYCDVNLIKKILQEQYVPDRIHWTDDYPNFRLTVKFTDSVVTMRTDSQLPFMLPIKIEGNTINGITYNAKLSMAISNILPDNFALKDRIAGVGLPKYI